MASIRKRKWNDKHGVEQTAWVVDYFDQSGSRRLKTFRTKKEAEDWRNTAVMEVKQGIHTPASSSKTVAEAWALWIAHCEAEDLERSTIRQRRQHLNLHIKSFIGNVKLADLTTPRVKTFLNDLREKGRSIQMRRKVLTNLKTTLSFAQGEGMVAQNVALAVRIKDDARQASSGPLRAGVDFPTRSELNAVIDRAPARWRPFLIAAIFTGMRASELRGLPWRDVDLDAGVIHVRQRADFWGSMGPPKSKAGKRDIPLAPIVVNALRQWKDDCPKGERDLVFPNGAGNAEGLTNLWKRFWRPLQLECGLTNESGEARYGFHCLRHAAASLFIQYLGWTPKRLQTVMGHSSVRMTFDLYGHLFEDTEKDRADMAKIELAVRAS
jgi:integrase